MSLPSHTLSVRRKPECDFVLEPQALWRRYRTGKRYRYVRLSDGPHVLAMVHPFDWSPISSSTILTSDATSTIALHASDGSGPRSKMTRSGCSRGQAPQHSMNAFDDAHLRELDQRLCIVCNEQRRMPRMEFRRQFVYARDACTLQIFLKREFALDSFGRTNECQRSVVRIRQCPLRNLLVIYLFSRRTVSLTQQAHHSRLSASSPQAARGSGRLRRERP
jgi:hypothetical protein